MKTKTEEKKSETENTRRSFLTTLWIILGGVALVELLAVVFAFLRPRRSKASGESKDILVIAGAVKKFVPNSVTAFVRGKFYLARLGDGGFLALSHKCTHLGCTVPWVEEDMHFACPCHGSHFDISGNVIEAPAPRALDIYPIIIENKMIKVDTRIPIKRSTFRPDQVVYPDKRA